MAKPWMTSQDLVSAVQRKIAIPLNQRTFSSDDILAFANEEMMISQVPDILMYHQEYFVWSEDIPLVSDQTRYPIPERAMGMKLRDVFYVDTNGNLFETTRVDPDDKAYWQRESGTINLMQKYYLEGNDVVLAPQNLQSPTGSLRFSYYLRPNQLVDNSLAAIVDSFFTNLTIVSSSMNAGDTLTLAQSLVFTAVASSPGSNEFQLVTGNDALTAANLVTAINMNGTYTATSSGGIVTVSYTDLSKLYGSSQQQVQYYIIPSNPNGILVSQQIGFSCSQGVPSNILTRSLADILQTSGGHKLYAKDVIVQSASTNTISFNASDVPLNFQIGDYICSQYECIIPQLPSDLHNGLAERVCARILAAQGDMQGLQISQSKISDIKHSEGILSENRVEGSTQKVTQRKSLLSMQRMGIRRRI